MMPEGNGMMPQPNEVMMAQMANAGQENPEMMTAMPEMTQEAQAVQGVQEMAPAMPAGEAAPQPNAGGVQSGAFQIPGM